MKRPGVSLLFEHDSKRKPLALKTIALAVIGGLLLAGCGSSSGSETTTPVATLAVDGTNEISDAPEPAEESQSEPKPDAAPIVAPENAVPEPKQKSKRQQQNDVYRDHMRSAGETDQDAIDEAISDGREQCNFLRRLQEVVPDEVPYIMANLDPELDPVAVEAFCPKFKKHVKAAVAGFGEGTWTVGGDIDPGTYRTVPGIEDCYWERTTGGGATIANDFVSVAPSGVTVTIRQGEGFVSQGCGGWLPK